MLLEIDRITVHYGKSRSIHEVSLNVAERDIVSIIGGQRIGQKYHPKGFGGPHAA